MPPDPSTLTFRPVSPDEPMGPIARLPSLAFGTSPEDCTEWFEKRVTRPNIRVAERDRTPLGCVGRVPMGLHVAGNAVPMLGVLGVADDPEARSTGVARQIMADAVREMHRDGVPLSGLYSALHGLYRAVGYEHAGLVCDATVPAGLFPHTPGTTPWRPITDDDSPRILGCYRRYAHQSNGALDRPEYIWHRIRERHGKANGFCTTDDTGDITAYCYTVQADWPGRGTDTGSCVGATLNVTDLAWSTPEGLAALASFLRGFSSVVGEVHLSLPPASPLLTALPDWRYLFTIKNVHFVRIINPKPALEQRGYLAGVSTALTLDLTDDIIEANTAPLTVTLDNGAPTVSRTRDAPAIALHIRDLAPLYTGFASPAALHAAGRLKGDPDALARATALFAVPSPPAMPDMY